MVKRILTIFVFAVFFVSPAWAEVNYMGRITAIVGKVEVGRKGSPVTVPARAGESLFAGDNVKTRDNSKATISLSDNSLIHIGENSNIRMTSLLLNKETEKRSVSINAFTGRFRFIVMKIIKITASGGQRPWRDSAFTVTTPTAVVGVKGTDFGMDVSTDKTVTTVFDGIVDQKSSNPNIKGGVIIGKNYSSSVTSGDAPSEPVFVAPEQMQAFEEATAVDTAVAATGETTEGAITEGAITEGAITEGAITEGAVTEGAVTEGAVTEETVTEETVFGYESGEATTVFQDITSGLTAPPATVCASSPC